MSDRQALRLPVRRFWLLSESIDRMKSADDMRGIRVASAVLGQDAYTATMESLGDSVGTIAVKIDSLDMSGVERLKRLMS